MRIFYFEFFMEKNRCVFPEAEVLSRLQTDINTFMTESYASFILNGVTDASWDDFQKTLGDLGVDEYLKIYQDSYNRYSANLD